MSTATTAATSRLLDAQRTPRASNSGRTVEKDNRCPQSKQGIGHAAELGVKGLLLLVHRIVLFRGRPSEIIRSSPIDIL
jgi:hypothetical protein